MKPAKAAPSKNNFLFFVAALFYVTAVFWASSAHRSPQPQAFWMTSALNACLGTAFLARGIYARNKARREQPLPGRVR